MGEKVLRLVIEQALSNGGLITAGEAQALGLDRSSLIRRVDDGVLIRVSRGLFALPGAELRRGIDLGAACHRLNAVVSHQSAAELHGFDTVVWGPPTVTVPHRLTNRYPGIYVHQSTDIAEEHVDEVNGLPVTNPERTIIDLAAILSDARLDWVLDRALSAGVADLGRLSELFSTLARRGKPGITRLRRMLEKRDPEWAPSDTLLETRLLRIITDAGLPRPVQQFHAPWLVPTNGRVDLAYPDRRLVIEGDSRRWHLLMKAFNVDRQRDNQAQLAGWRILRFTWEDITKRPESVVATVTAAVRV